MPSLIAQRHVTNNNNKLSQSSERLSSGKRVNRAKDDAAGLAISENIRAHLRSLERAKQNAGDGISLVQVAEGSMADISNSLIRMRELAMQSSNGSIGDYERSLLNKEYIQLADEIDRINSSAEFMGRKLFTKDRDFDSLDLQVGMNGDQAVKLSFEGINFSTKNLKIGNQEEIGSLDVDGSVDTDEITEKLGIIDNALNNINTHRAALGAVQSRMESVISSHTNTIESFSDAKSRIVDADFATEAAKQVQARILTQSSASVLVHANQAPEVALGLIR